MTILMSKIDDKYLDDCKRIKNILFDRGTDESLRFAQNLWGHISVFFYKTEWAILPTRDEDVYDVITLYTTVSKA